jgi:photosynthetic reaction center cytochrome c subunit
MDERGSRQKTRIMLIFVFALLVVSVGFSISRQVVAQTSIQPPQPTQPAEKVYKNIRVLNGTRAADLQGAMSFIAGSLGVDCDYCHRQDKEGTFASDAVPAKLRAREMILMVRSINRETFHGENVVNCFTCHQGSTTPISIAKVLGLVPPRPTEASPVAMSGEKLPTKQEVLGNYVKALGGQTALDGIKTRIITIAPLGEATSEESVEQIFQKTPGKVLLFQKSPGYTLWAAFNGQQAWAQDSLKSYWGLLSASQLNSIMRDSEMYAGCRIENQYANVLMAGKDRVADRDTFVIAGTSPEGSREKFYFDARTGLLLRRHIEEPTLFGWFPLDIDFEGYREVGGVKIPFVLRLSSEGGAYGTQRSYMILDVHQNVPIEDGKFDHP